MGATDADYDLVYRTAVVPVIEQFSPGLVLVSAGFDAHERDPLASMRVTTAGYASVVRHLMTAAGKTPIAFVTEGGYELHALAECLDASFAAVSESDSNSDAEQFGSEPERSDANTARAERALKAVRGAQAPFWRGI
jgi:acetoin utilization deacetylase AcuC-like enzyme